MCHGNDLDMTAYKAFLEEIGYLLPRGGPFTVATSRVDPEISRVAGPQLVCPVDNARFVLNAANARWGSLLDALYGSDAVGGAAPRPGPYDAERGAHVFAAAHAILDEIFPLRDGAAWADVTSLDVDPEGGALVARVGARAAVGLRDEAQLAGFRPGLPTPRSVLLVNHGLHVELVIDRAHAVGATHAAGVCDIQLESALSTICDAEDSACTVDADDKLVVCADSLATLGRSRG